MGCKPRRPKIGSLINLRPREKTLALVLWLVLAAHFTTSGAEITDLTHSGTRSASSVFSGFPVSLGTDGDTNTNWYSDGRGGGAGPGGPNTERFTWQSPEQILFSTIELVRESMGGFGFASLQLRVTNAQGAVFETNMRQLPGKRVEIQERFPLNLIGNRLDILLFDHENPACGGFSELNLFGSELGVDYYFSGAVGDTNWHSTASTAPSLQTNWLDSVDITTTEPPGARGDERVFIVDQSVVLDQGAATIGPLSATGSLTVRQSLTLGEDSDVGGLILDASASKVVAGANLTVTGLSLNEGAIEMGPSSVLALADGPFAHEAGGSQGSARIDGGTLEIQPGARLQIEPQLVTTSHVINKGTVVLEETGASGSSLLLGESTESPSGTLVLDDGVIENRTGGKFMLEDGAVIGASGPVDMEAFNNASGTLQFNGNSAIVVPVNVSDGGNGSMDSSAKAGSPSFQVPSRTTWLTTAFSEYTVPTP